MAQQYASGETMRLTLKLTPAATSMTWNKDVGTTSGRFFLSNNNQVEWISFSGITNNGDGTYTYTGLTRGLSQTADPVTAGTGSTWLQNQECILVAMHDQLVDKTQDVTLTKDLYFSGTTTGGLVLKSLTTAQRNALTPVVWYKIFNSTTGTVQTYYSGTWNDEGTSTTPNASTTVAGKVEIATQVEVDAGTDVGGTGATVVVIPSTFQSWVTTKITAVTASNSDAQLWVSTTKFITPAQVNTYYRSIGGTGADGALSIAAGTTTLAFDATGYIEKNYTSFTMTGGTLNFSGPATNGGIAVIKVSGDFSMTWSSTIDISGMGGLGTTSSSGSQWKYIVFNQNITNFWVIWSGTRLGWTGLGTNGGYIYGYCWGGGGSWASGAGAASWASGGWLIIIEVGWTFTFNTPSVINANGATATNGWGWGGGWAVIIKYRTLLSNTWSITVNGGSSWSSTLGAGGGGGWSFSTGGTGWTIGNPGTAWTSNSFWTGGTGGTASGGWGGGGGWAGFYKIN